MAVPKNASKSHHIIEKVGKMVKNEICRRHAFRINTFSGTEIPGTIALWGGTFNGTLPMTYVFQNVLVSGDYKTQISLNFSIPPGSNGNAVISWGGHLAAEADWGIGNSSSSITGLPYHMIFALLDGASPGSQDRSLATSAVFPTLAVFEK